MGFVESVEISVDGVSTTFVDRCISWAHMRASYRALSIGAGDV
jgi:hypothetical protein